jgi:hypothetical protein
MRTRSGSLPGLEGVREWMFCTSLRGQDSSACLLGKARSGRGRPWSAVGSPGRKAVYTLRILATAGASAIFEIIGVDGAAYPGMLRAENAAGMVLVNHTWTHADLAGDGRPRWTAPAACCKGSPAIRSGAFGRRTA